jgi:hypothetical protein
MAATVFTNIDIYQDTVNNRNLIANHNLYGYDVSGVAQPDKALQGFDYTGDTLPYTPGTLFADSFASAKNIVPNGKLLLRIKALPTSSTGDGAQYLAPLVKNFRVGNTLTQSALTKISSGNNKLGYIFATNPAGNVDTLIFPKPSPLAAFTIKKLTFGAPSGSITQVFNLTTDDFEPLGSPRSVSPDQYFTRYQYNPGDGESPSEAYPTIVSDLFPSTDPYDLYVWFELTPAVPIVNNIRIRIDSIDTYEFVTLGANNCPVAI